MFVSSYERQAVNVGVQPQSAVPVTREMMVQMVRVCDQVMVDIGRQTKLKRLEAMREATILAVLWTSCRRGADILRVEWEQCWDQEVET